MSIYRISTNYGDRYTIATSAAKARANVAYWLRRYVAYVPSGTAAAWVAVVVPLGGYGRIKAKAERARK